MDKKTTSKKKPAKKNTTRAKSSTKKTKSTTPRSRRSTKSKVEKEVAKPKTQQRKATAKKQETKKEPTTKSKVTTRKRANTRSSRPAARTKPTTQNKRGKKNAPKNVEAIVEKVNPNTQIKQNPNAKTVPTKHNIQKQNVVPTSHPASKPKQHNTNNSSNSNKPNTQFSSAQKIVNHDRTVTINQNVAILIDGNNIEKSIHSLLNTKNAMLDFDNIIPKLLRKRGLNRLIYFREGLHISNKLAERLHKNYFGTVVPCHKSADIPLSITATQLADKVDTIIILSGDSDYVDLVRHLRSRGVRVEIAAIKQTTAKILIDEADFFTEITKMDCYVR